MIKRRPDDVLALIDIVKPDPTTVALSGQKAEVYRPKMAVVEEYDLRKYKNLVEQFLLLGFGSSGKDLTRSYNVKLAGSETIDGKPAWRLELVPKDKKTREQFNRIELWINADGYPVRQRFHEPNGNHRTVNYSNIKVNQDISAADLALKLPANVKREYPQK
jgi:outer membrane lipoprotein-sorting protein